MRTNHIMVDNSDWLVCYVRHGASNSRNLLEYAKRQGEKGLIRVVNIGENEADIKKSAVHPALEGKPRV